MNCWFCETELICEDDPVVEGNADTDVENLRCPNCHSLVLVFSRDDKSMMVIAPWQKKP
jgi:DNA-directed RNA polymerase subunit RPC12/RpoP